MANHGEVEPVLLKSERDLKNYFASHAKPACMHRIGVEAEFLPVYRKTGGALPYSARKGVGTLLKALACMHYYHPIKQGGKIIALNRKDLSVSLEPGGQVELSAPPVSTIFQVEEQVKQFIAQLKSLEKKFPEVMFLSAGIQPFSPISSIEWTPKERYKIMRRRLPEYGELSQWMMKMTGTNQANFDFSDEEDANQKMKVALLATPAAAALFANSCFSEGKPNGYQTFRMQIWQKTDQTRSGYLTQFLKSKNIFRDYLEYVLNVPMLFIIRKQKYIEVKGKTFRQFMRGGYQGEKATLADFELHLTALFPDVRLKQYLEVRCVDAQHPERISSVAAFWKGLIYAPSARMGVLKLFRKISEGELQKAYAELPRFGLQATLGDRTLLAWSRDLMDLACAGLSEQTTAYEKRSECAFLLPLQEDLKHGRTPADHFLKLLKAKKPQNRFWILDHLHI